MSLNLAAQKAPSVTTEFQGFSFDHGAFAYHTPSATIMAVPQAFVDYLHAPDGDLQKEQALLQLSEQLPKAKPRIKERIDITAIALNVEESCNLRCTYCYAGDGNYGCDTRMTFDVACTVIDQLSEGRSSFHITFFGGEPLLNFSLIKKVVTYCEQKENQAIGIGLAKTKFTYALTTNGTLLNETHIAFFKEHDIAVTISYDGKGLQSKQRKSQEGGRTLDTETWVTQKLNRHAKALSELKHMSLRTTISKAYISDLEGVLRDLLDSRQYQIAFSRVSSTDPKHVFTKEDIALLGASLRKVIDFYIQEQAWDKIDRISHIKGHMQQFAHGVRQQKFCGAGINYISVSTSGEYFLCHRFTENKDAKVGDYKEGLNKAKLTSIAQHRMALAEPCNSCWMRNTCAGGCFHENYTAHGDILTIDPLFCQLQHLEMTEAMRVYTLRPK